MIGLLLTWILIVPGEPLTYPERIGKMETYYQSETVGEFSARNLCEQFKRKLFYQHAIEIIKAAGEPERSFNQPGGTTFHLSWREVYRHGLCVDAFWWKLNRLWREKERIEAELRKLSQ